MTTPLYFLSATELGDRYRAGTLDPVTVTEAVLSRIEERNSTINAFYRVEAAHAREAAEASAERWRAGSPWGPLDGIPVTVKENVATVGTPMPRGTLAGAGLPPASGDGPVAAFLLRAGAVRIGKTVMPDYGMLASGVSSLHGVTRSPWNPAWTVGGSSSGAGAAAAAGFGPLHIGSDIAGSIRLPATWLGLVGFKPTWATVPVDPPFMGRCSGPITRTVADAVLLMDTLIAPDARDFTQVPTTFDAAAAAPAPTVAGLRVGLLTDAGWGSPVDPEVAATVRAAADLFAAAGAQVDEIGPIVEPASFESLDAFLRTRILRDLDRLAPERRAEVLPFIMEWAEAARGFTGADVFDAFGGIQRLRHTVAAAMVQFDVILSPVSPGAAFPAEWPMPTNDPQTSLHDVGFTSPYNFAENPAISVNGGFTSDGRPIGIQLAAARFDDERLLAIAGWFEANRPADAVPVWPV